MRIRNIMLPTILQRVSALLVLVLLHIHMKAYAHMATGTALSAGQTAFFCVTELLFFASVLTHIAVSVSKGVITLVLTEPDEPVVRVMKYNDSSVDVITRSWCNTPDYWEVYFDLVEQVRAELEQNGIEIPYNQLDVHVKTMQNHAE